MKSIISLLIRFIPRKYLQRVSGVGLKALSIFYKGNHVQCPICEKEYRKFLPYGRLRARPNALCPSCQSLERHRLIWLYLKGKTNFFSSNLDVLHIAPESCFLKPFQNLHGEKYITADIESPLAKIKLDIHQMPFPENHFDVVLCNHVLEHVRNDIAALKEIYRVLKPGGWSILQIPFFHPIPERTLENPAITNPKEREKLFGQSDHVRKYGKDYPARIEQAGLKCLQIDYATGVDKKYAVANQEILFIGKKPD